MRKLLKRHKPLVNGFLLFLFSVALTACKHSGGGGGGY